MRPIGYATKASRERTASKAPTESGGAPTESGARARQPTPTEPTPPAPGLGKGRNVFPPCARDFGARGRGWMDAPRVTPTQPNPTQPAAAPRYKGRVLALAPCFTVPATDHDTALAESLGMGAGFLSTAEGGLGGEAFYCAVILWLSVVSWVIFTRVDNDGGDGRRRRTGRRGGGSRGSPVFVGAAGLCDGTGPGCSGGYGLCGTCLD
ncbi:uncharacterized protein LOC133901809 [Phragmites australis]|uniref:uncharacterized protein LOC133901809 n=1 Tax=Phragmites australis TaxID=29695 RepID=UPI002D7851B4|nr:uncharacterized protein LOC133901809 [Phragmites australis]